MKTVKIFLLIIIIFMIGTFGYVVIEDWSIFDAFYMTAISITTVGFGETKPLSSGGKLFTVLIIFLGLGAAAVFATQLAKAFLESHFKNFFGANKMLKKINRLKDHYIICGYGGVGSAICATLNDSGIKFVVIEQDEDVAQWAEKRNFMTVIGKATYDSTLIQAGISNAKGIVVSMGDDSLNMYVSLAARELNKDIFIIARGYKADIESRLVRAGANTVVYPIKMGGEQIAHLIKRQLHTESSITENVTNSVMGYTLKHYSYPNEIPSTVGDIKQDMKATNIITIIKKTTNKEISNPDDNVAVNIGDSLLLVIIDGNKEEKVVHKDSVFFWSEKHEIDNSILDEEHKALFQISFEFVEAVQSNQDKDIIIKNFNQLVEKTIEHYRNEERLFKQYNYPDLKDHIKVHKKLLSSITNLNKNRNYDFDSNIEAVLFSSQIEHIMSYDKKFVDYIKENFHG